MEVYKEFSFDAAHRLPNAPEGHKCRNLHGHTYKVTLFFEGEINKVTGWFLDFNEIKTVFQPTLDILDHSYLNDIIGLENPTSEILAIWIWNTIKEKLPMLSKVKISETQSSGCIYTGE